MNRHWHRLPSADTSDCTKRSLIILLLTRIRSHISPTWSKRVCACQCRIQRDLHGSCPLAASYVQKLPSVPLNASFDLSSYSLHHNHEFFPHPHEFFPERWLEPTPQMLVARSDVLRQAKPGKDMIEKFEGSMPVPKRKGSSWVGRYGWLVVLKKSPEKKSMINYFFNARRIGTLGPCIGI